MRLSAQHVMDAILHPDREVREAAVYYFSRSCSLDPAVMPLVLRACNQYGPDAFESWTFLAHLVHNDETVAWLIRQLEERQPGVDKYGLDVLEHFAEALCNANLDLLERQFLSIQAVEQLNERFLKHLANRLELRSASPDDLWDDLVVLSDYVDDAGFPTDVEADYAAALVEALARHTNSISDRALGIIQDEEQGYGDYLITMAVRLVGELRLESAVPDLVGWLGSADDLIAEETHDALVKIGGEAVVRELVSRYDEEERDFAIGATSVLEDIHSDSSVQASVDLLAAEDDPELKGSLLQAVLMNFSPLGIEPARQFILEIPKDPDVLEVREALLTACKLLNATFPEYEAWVENAKTDDEFRRQWSKEHPFPLADDDDFDEELDLELDEEFDEEDGGWEGARDENLFLDEEPPGTISRHAPRVGRNDPCPCGSGKKYKKCCLSKELAGDEESASGSSSAAVGVSMSGSEPRFPIGTVASYGPDDKTTTKLVAAVIKRPGAEPILERWIGPNLTVNPRVQRQIKNFFQRHHVHSVVASDGNMGCPHEEGVDFPQGEDCPRCPYWAGKQGSNRHG
jgi:hypothetical protein